MEGDFMGSTSIRSFFENKTKISHMTKDKVKL